MTSKLLWQYELNPRVRCAIGNVFSYSLPAPHILQKSTSPIAHSSLQQEQFCLAPDMKLDLIIAKDLKKTMDYIFYLQYKVHQYPCHSVLEHGPHRHSGIVGGWMRWMATDLSQEYYYKVTSIRSFIRVNKIRIFESYLDQHLNSSIRPTGCQAARR